MESQFAAIDESNNGLHIKIKHKPEWAILIWQTTSLLVLLTITFGVSAGLFLISNFLQIIILIFLGTSIFLALRGILWQLLGYTSLDFSNNICVVKSIAPLTKRQVEYTTDASVTTFDFEYDSRAEHQIHLNILSFSKDLPSTYHYSTLASISGFNELEVEKLVNALRHKIQKTGTNAQVRINSYGRQLRFPHL